MPHSRMASGLSLMNRGSSHPALAPGAGAEAVRLLLHQVLQRGLLRSMTLAVNRGVIRRPLRLTGPMACTMGSRPVEPARPRALRFASVDQPVACPRVPAAAASPPRASARRPTGGFAATNSGLSVQGRFSIGNSAVEGRDGTDCRPPAADLSTASQRTRNRLPRAATHPARLVTKKFAAAMRVGSAWSPAGATGAPQRRPLADRGAHAVLTERGLRTSSARGGPSTMAQERPAQATDRCRRPAAWRHPGKSRPARAAEHGQQRAAVRSASSVLSARGGRKGHGANGR